MEGPLSKMLLAVARGFVVWLRERDWGLLLLVGLFLVLMPWNHILPALFPWLLAEARAPFPAYEKALSRAAIKTPADQRRLRTIENEVAQLVTLRSSPLSQGEQVIQRDIWVALPDELQSACRGADDARTRLQQVLGLPPRGGSHHLYPVAVDTRKLLRPCMSGDGPTSDMCTFNLPKDPTDATEVSQEALVAAYRHLRFVAGQMWGVYRTGFRDPRVAEGDYPYTGYPFTGMGWSYDWGDGSSSNVGITEFVVPKGTAVTIGAPLDPAGFCAATPR